MEPPNDKEAPNDDAITKPGAAEGAPQPADVSISGEPFFFANSDPDADRLTAIERQRLKEMARSPGDIYREAQSRYLKHPPATSKPRISLVLTALLIATSVALVYTNREHALFKQLAASISTLSAGKRGESSASTAAIKTEPRSEPEATPTIEPTAPQPVAADAQASETVEHTPGNPLPVEPETQSQPIALPIDQLSLQKQPDLYKQLVLLYRGQLDKEPDNADAATALHQLQTQALAELNEFSNSDAAVKQLLSANVIALFPELTESVRQQFAPIPRDSSTSNSLQVDDRDTLNADDPVNPSDDATIATNSPADTHTKTEDKGSAPPPRPEIVSLSMTSGVIVNNRFEARNEGGALMVSLGYRNFSNSPASPNDDTLIMIIRAPGNPWVLAEESVTIPGDRGTKNFSIQTAISENITDQFQVDIVLNGRRLDSRIVAHTANSR